MSNANRVKTEFMLFMVVIIWGANYTVGKFGVAQLSPQWFTTPVTFQIPLSAWYDGISKMDSHAVMVYMFSIPVVAMVTAYFAIHESIHLGQIIGAVIIFVGTVLLRSQSSHAATKAGRNPSTKSEST